MSKEELYELYGKVLTGDKVAQNKLVKEHKRLFPKHYVHRLPKNEWGNATQTYHMMYMHLTR